MLDLGAELNALMPKSYLSSAHVSDLVGRRLGHVLERGRHLAMVSGEDYFSLQKETKSLIEGLFIPPEDGSNFTELDHRKFALVERFLGGPEAVHRFVELHGDNAAFPEQYATLYANANLESGIVPAQGVNDHSDVILEDMFRYILDPNHGIITNPDKAHIMVIWRAACGVLEAAHRHGIKKAIHVAMTRGHGSKAEIYYRGESLLNKLDPSAEYLIWDPMIATAWSMHLAIEELEKQGVPTGQISTAGMFVAPEGIARLLNLHPGLRRSIACRVEGGMDNNAYLKRMRVGDYGDLIAGSFSEKRIVSWEEQLQMMTRTEARDFLKRMRGESLSSV